MLKRLLNIFKPRAKSNRAMSTLKAGDIHPDTQRPIIAWRKLQVKQRVDKVVPMAADTPISDDNLRIVCLSDTHAKIEARPEIVPDGDILLHAGDFTQIGQTNDVVRFNQFLGERQHPLKIVIAGNHDLSFDDDLVQNHRDHLRRDFGLTADGLEKGLERQGVENVKDLLTNCVYLEDAALSVCGVNIYGSPWQPEFCDWGFNLPRGQTCLDKWNLIPDDTDILITHGPPIGHGDMCFDGQRAGCVELLSIIQQRVKPKYHIFGHIHEGYGVTTDGQTQFINASTCTLRYRADNTPIVFDYPIPEGHSKAELLNIKPMKLIRDRN